MRKVFGGAVVTFVMTSLFAVATRDCGHRTSSGRTHRSRPASDSLVVDYKVAGLGNTVTTSVALRAERTATWACKDDDDNFPGDPLAITPSAGTTLLGPFPATGGQVAGTISVSPGTPAQCPDGQVVTLVELSYTDVRIIHSSAGTRSIPGTFSSVVDPTGRTDKLPNHQDDTRPRHR